MEILTQNEFDVLVALESSRSLAGALRLTRLDEAAVDAAAEKLLGLGFTARQGGELTVTPAGYAWLEPHRVRRAILLAAGFGSRLRPVTDTTPKPLVKVRGTRLIETLIGALQAKHIDDITIVTGYRSDDFDVLRRKYPEIRFVYNSRYETENNISSAMLVREKYGSAYVTDADLYLKNPDIIRKYEYASNYLGIPVEKTDDWCLAQEKPGGKITGMVRGGSNTHLMVGLSYWTEADGRQFARDAEALYARQEGRSCFWDDVALTHFNDHYALQVRECGFDDIVEIDTVEDLVAMDDSYSGLLEQ